MRRRLMLVLLAFAVAAVTAFARAGEVVWEVALVMAIGQLVGGALGAQLAMKGGERVVRVLVLVVSGVLCAKLAWQLVS